MGDKDILDILLHSTDRLTECEIKAIENLIARYKELETIVKTYNAIPNDYIPNDVKIVIADREYFNNGMFKENLIPKSKIKEKIEFIKSLNEKLYYEENVISILQELLED
jgi:hypothetical protein